MFGIISGSGLYEIPGLAIAESTEVMTPFGSPSDRYRKGLISGKKVCFLPRHGAAHQIQPHKINYRANIWGFRELGVTKIISIGAAGGMTAETKPGTIAVPEQIIDVTSGRPSTFYDQDEVVHIDFTDPFCPEIRSAIFAAANHEGIDLLRSGVYVCVNGPRLETAAEIKTYSLWGADIVGMTAMPEAVLAREAGICFAGIYVITNYAAGLTAGKLTVTEVVNTMEASAGVLRSLLAAFFAQDFSPFSCSCGRGIEESKI